ncbi:hypothetical protein PRZ48_012172 [Zasmidium cellare]|uniref:Uncharacterized protein n=1 Tax=Zasmidium cellare TaxID=395010 RepID=A0ABR0E463_ZASCE|nr:hypothetical protein PRZ48_012172 [Zasmidium cellare]
MSATPKMTVDNPSLGTLERLPAELRNTIYELAIETEYELEADFHRPCRQRQSLHLVSKQIHQETIGFLAVVRYQPCRHVNFAVTIPEAPETPSHERILQRIAGQLSPVHNIVQAQTIRFITGHLDGDAPLAVTCHLRLPTDSYCQVYGAREQRATYVTQELNSALGTLQHRVAMTIGSLTLRELEDLAVWVSVLVQEMPLREREEFWEFWGEGRWSSRWY